jgi:ketopantoate hydroxymethyltransferase
MDGVKAASVGTDDDYQVLKSLSDMLGSLKRMQAALVKKFGDDAKAIPDLSSMMSAQIEGAEEKVDGDSATLIVKDKPDDKHPPTLKKTGDDWKMDLKSMNSDPEFAKMKDKAPKAVELIDGYTKDVESGKYPTFAEAAQALGQTMGKLGP